MPYYRLFFFGPDYHIVRAKGVDLACDEDAIAFAHASRGDRTVEVWELDRHVERIDAATAGTRHALTEAPLCDFGRSGFSEPVMPTLRPPDGFTQ